MVVVTVQVRYSVACRSIVDPQGKVLLAGHGGRYATYPDGPCPVCRRPMVTTGQVTVQQVRRG